jgi:hypothetical protein
LNDPATATLGAKGAQTRKDVPPLASGRDPMPAVVEGMVAMGRLLM